MKYYPTLSAGRHFAAAIAAVFVLGSAVCRSADGQSASAIYQQKCASCHGADGQGAADGYEEPLYGDYSIDALAELIERTMPEDAPENCVGEEARQIAAYIFREFYSPRARHEKGLAAVPRIELTRLTVPQYRNAVADLIGRFTPAPRSDTSRRRGRGRGRRRQEDVGATVSESSGREPDREPSAPEPGLRGEYFQSKGMSKADKLGEQRVDRRIDFDFGESSPAEGITADQFTIIWQGAVFADDTGDYEFRVRTQNGARLYLNSDPPEDRRKLRDDSDVAGQSALIDAWVSSGQMREQTARVFLLGGRKYPLRLEFFKYLEKTASIKLEWKPPHGTWSVLDDRHLTTAVAARVFVVEGPFPADDRSLGYERGSSVSQEWHAATIAGAVAAAAEVVDRLPRFANSDEDRSRDSSESPPSSDASQETLGREERLKEFLVRFARVAYRRPLTSEEVEFFREFPFADTESPEAAVRRAVLFILESPYFLYTDLTPVGQSPDPYAIAARLSLALWDSMPDEPLLEAADNGQLATVEQIEAQARRMLADLRTRAKTRDFFHHWLEFGERDLGKDKDMFPEFDEAVVADLRYSLEAFLEEVFWSESSDYRQLLLADYLVLNERLRALYSPEGLDECDATEADALADFQRVPFPPERRAGVLTHPYLLSALAYHNNSSPIHRGVFLTRNIVGRPLKPPPVAVAFKDDEFAPDLTMREKITQLTRDTACMSCHSAINPLGFALENYDALGRWRTSENQKPVDTRSQYTTAGGETLELESARDVANFAAGSESAHRAFVTQVFHHLVKQHPAAFGADTVDRLVCEFVNDDFNMQNLLVRIAVLSATHGPAATPSPSKESEAIP